MIKGYGRVSTDAQELQNQRAALEAAGCTRFYMEKITGTKLERPELTRMLENLEHGDVVVVTRLDRLARSTRDLLKIMDDMNAAGATIRSLSETWADTTTDEGRFVMTMFAGAAEFERALIVKRTGDGRTAALKRGVRFGRPSKIEAAVWKPLERQIRAGELSVPQVAKILNCNKATVFRKLARSEVAA